MKEQIPQIDTWSEGNRIIIMDEHKRSIAVAIGLDSLTGSKVAPGSPGDPPSAD